MTMQRPTDHAHLVARFRNPPSRVAAAIGLLGAMVGLPAILGTLAILFENLELEPLAFLCGALACLSFVGAIIAGWAFIYRGASLLKRAEQSFFAGNFMAVTDDAFFVLKTVFRADYRVTALYIMGLAAERAGCFEEAAKLFTQGASTLPAMLASVSARRARALMYSHAAINWAALGRAHEARASLGLCHQALGPQQSGIMDIFRIDDSQFGQLGLADRLNELEGRRDPRPLAALAGAFVALRSGDHYAALDMVTREGPALSYGLAPDERVLLSRIASEASSQLGSADPHRTMARVDEAEPAAPWVEAMLARRGV